jgi:hypothetical protein
MVLAFFGKKNNWSLPCPVLLTKIKINKIKTLAIGPQLFASRQITRRDEGNRVEKSERARERERER